MLCQILQLRTTYLIDCSEMWRLQRDKRESRDPAGKMLVELCLTNVFATSFAQEHMFS